MDRNGYMHDIGGPNRGFLKSSLTLRTPITPPLNGRR
jgi:hypothetical protein